MQSKILILLLLISVGGCSSPKLRKEVQDSINQTKPIVSNNELNSIEQQELSESKNLNKEQQEKLQSLIEKTSAYNKKINEEIYKTRAVLFKEIVGPKTATNKTKIKILESQLYKLNRKKTRNSLELYKETKEIVGKNDDSLERTLLLIDKKTNREY